MTLRVNGTDRQIPAGPDGAGGERVTVHELLVHLGLADRPCAVEVDGEIVRHRDHATRRLADGQRVEIVTLVGGG
ncbi:MAG: sulfur carrier protein ThiS [Planctomycetota bacterium]|nr:sulfur carrier protein ThiS [Planctomycetota bacterium]MDA1105719.1 sulfur carrier protein ThiS [Planctomycetota bacterium]